jgi:hypothetical protein
VIIVDGKDIAVPGTVVVDGGDATPSSTFFIVDGDTIGGSVDIHTFMPEFITVSSSSLDGGVVTVPGGAVLFDGGDVAIHRAYPFFDGGDTDSSKHDTLLSSMTKTNYNTTELLIKFSTLRLQLDLLKE